MDKDMLELIEKYQGLLNDGVIDYAHAASSIMFEMAEEEMRTNKRYAPAFEFAINCIAKAGDEEGAEVIRSNANEIMGDEDNHCTRLKALASGCIDLEEPED